MSFKDQVYDATRSVFLNTDAFAEKRTVRYDGEEYTDIPILLAKVKQEAREPTGSRELNYTSNHTQGLYQVTAILRCDIRDLGGKQPEKGTKISINDEGGGGGFFRDYYIASSACTMGMLRVELEAIDE